ncbi:MAG: tetratricopeptide repeat protein [bacterium]|nr:tetratricopeptide repeat protein [bacterium]
MKPYVSNTYKILSCLALFFILAENVFSKGKPVATEEKQPKLSEAQKVYSFGYEYLKNKMYDEAIKNFESAIQESASYIDAYLNLSIAYKGKCRFDKMQETYNKMEKFSPIKTYYALGSLYTELGKKDSAIIEYKKALELDSTYADALYGLGYVYEKMKKDTVIEVYKDSTTSEWKSILVKKNSLDVAIEYYKAALKYAPKNESVRYSLANAFISQKKYNEGIEELKALRDAYPEDFDVRKALGRAYLSAKKYNEAKSEFEYIAQKLPDNRENKINFGYAYEGLKEYGSALQSYNEAISLDTSDVYSYFPAINLCLTLSNLSEATRYLQKARLISPDNQILHCLAGDIQFQSAIIASKNKNLEGSENGYQGALNEYRLALNGEAPEWQAYAKKYIKQVEDRLKEVKKEIWWHKSR